MIDKFVLNSNFNGIFFSLKKVLFFRKKKEALKILKKGVKTPFKKRGLFGKKQNGFFLVKRENSKKKILFLFGLFYLVKPYCVWKPPHLFF